MLVSRSEFSAAAIERAESSFAHFEAERADHVEQLAMHVVPLAQPQLGEKILLHRPAKLAARNVFLQAMVKIPQPQIRNEIAVGIGESGVCGVGLLLLVGRAMARILRFERGGDDQHIGQACSSAAASSMRPMRGSTGNCRELFAERRQFLLVIDRAELEQRRRRRESLRRAADRETETRRSARGSSASVCRITDARFVR